MLEDKEFFDLESDYREPITDQATPITKATRGGAIKEVQDYGQAPPKGMQEIEEAIIAVMEKIE